MNNTVIRITPEVPVDMVLAFTEGKPVANGKMMFSTTDGRSLFVPEAAGREIQQRLNDLRIRPGDRVLIRQGITHNGGVRETSWEVYRASVAVGQQRDGSFIVPAQPGAEKAPPALPPPSPPAAAQPNGRPAGALEHCGPAAPLRQRATLLIDVYAGMLRYARQCHADLDMAPADIRELVAAAYAGIRRDR